jgi:putative glutamine amidotransferase
MPTVTINVGVCVRFDGGGSGHNWDRTSLNAARQLFDKPIKLGRLEEPYTVNINPVPVPKNFSGAYDHAAKKPVVAVGELNPASGKVLATAREKMFTPVTENADGRYGKNEAIPANALRITQSDLAGIDLLYVPGAAAATPTQRTDTFGMKPDSPEKATEATSRDAFEKALIAKAMTMGIPVLAVCAGSWRLLESFGGSVRELSSEEVGKHHLTAFDVTELNQIEDLGERKVARKLRGEEMLKAAKEKYGDSASSWSLSHELNVHDRGGIVRGAAVKAAHDLLVKPQRKVLPINKAFERAEVRFEGANSTHWAVGDATRSTPFEPGRIRQRQFDAHTPTNERLNPSELLQVVASDPKTGEMEGFETVHGVPMVGAQWHPEGYLDGQPGVGMPYTKPGIVAFSRNLFHYMVLAAVTAKLRKTGVINDIRHHCNLRNVQKSEMNFRDNPLKAAENEPEGVRYVRGQP